MSSMWFSRLLSLLLMHFPRANEFIWTETKAARFDNPKTPPELGSPAPGTLRLFWKIKNLLKMLLRNNWQWRDGQNRGNQILHSHRNTRWMLISLTLILKRPISGKIFFNWTFGNAETKHICRKDSNKSEIKHWEE